MPLTCDCYGGCWGDHSAFWPHIPYRPFASENHALTLIVHRLIPYGSFVTMGDGFRVETEEYKTRVLDEYDFTQNTAAEVTSLEDVEIDDVRELLGGLIGKTIVDVTTDDWEEVCENYPEEAGRKSYVYLHLSDGTTAAFACLGNAGFAYPAEPSELITID